MLKLAEFHSYMKKKTDFNIYMGGQFHQFIYLFSLSQPKCLLYFVELTKSKI